MNAARRALYSLAAGIALEAVLFWLIGEMFNLRNPSRLLLILLDLHAPAGFLVGRVFGSDYALANSALVMALFWSAVFFAGATLTRKLKRLPMGNRAA